MVATNSPTENVSEKCPVNHETMEAFLPSDSKAENSNVEAKCPVNPEAMKAFLPSNTEGKQLEAESKCPVDPESMKAFLPPDQKAPTPPTEGCDSNSISTTNYMPAPNQNRAEDQNKDLSLDREVSTIPRGGESSENYWVYPSEQMFFNAMKRKSWTPSEDDMATVVPIHNAVNEMCWKKILEWEALHENKCGGPKLIKFQGKPRDYTPKARLRNLFGYKLPFDRHDWTVDRCGKPVRYVIDFYSGKADPNSPSSVSFYLDVRPAVSVEGVMDRIRRLFSD